MKAKDIMTKEIITIKEEDTVEVAAGILNEKGISGLPVVDEDHRLKGIITEGDLIRRVAKISGPSTIEILGGILPLERKKDFIDKINRYMGYLVKDMMTKDVITISEDTEIEEIATLMVKEKIKRIPVVDGEKRLIGIISRRDIMKNLFDEIR
ncbi:MAG: CBS domain-containing protein [Tissierella sp.]|nr:CBS domain-containing protein [Tissierella sp.]